MTIKKKGRLCVSVSAAVFIENEEGRLLLLRQAKSGLWGPPAGGMQPHEDPITTAIREAKEETGYDVRLLRLLSIKTVDRGNEDSGLGFTFRGIIIGGELKLNKEEVIEAFWFDKEGIKTLVENNAVYKPEYNIDAFNLWMKDESYPIGSISRM